MLLVFKKWQRVDVYTYTIHRYSFSHELEKWDFDEHRCTLCNLNITDPHSIMRTFFPLFMRLTLSILFHSLLGRLTFEGFNIKEQATRHVSRIND